MNLNEFVQRVDVLLVSLDKQTLFTLMVLLTNCCMGPFFSVILFPIVL